MDEIENSSQLDEALKCFNVTDRHHWLAEIIRLKIIVENYDTLMKKRKLNRETNKYEFLPEVFDLCKSAACSDHVVVTREPHRARPPSPETLDQWSRNYKKKGLTAFLRSLSSDLTDSRTDKRRKFVTPLAINWLNTNFRKHQGSTALYNNLQKEAEKHGWTIPSRSWLYRRWKEIPKIVEIYVFEGKKAYESKIAPYVPRNYEDLDALQVLCGDHFERDVTVNFGNGVLARPWLTVWLCLRTYLIWGWYLSFTPTSEAIALAYADGLTKFGAQPFSRPEDDYYSYIQTDRGKTYCSHDISGKVIKVHQDAFSISNELQTILTEKKVGLVAELDLVHLLTRGRNAKEKAIERIGKDFSHWEANTFVEYCGKDASSRPEKWYELYKQHKNRLKDKIKESPFISFERYRLALKDRIEEFNSTVHERVTLGGKKIIPLNEFHRLYLTKYVIPEQTVALLLLKPEPRTIEKDGVKCFQTGWYYDHPDMDFYRGRKVEIRYTDHEYLHIWVVLPNKNMCQAKLITPTSLIKPNKQTLQIVKESRRRQKQIIKDYQLITESNVRGESVEDSTAIELKGKKVRLNDLNNSESLQHPASKIYKFPQINRNKISVADSPKKIDANDVRKANSEDLKAITNIKRRIREFDFEE